MNNHLANRIYSTILHFDESIDVENAWDSAKQISENKDILEELIIHRNVFNLDSNKNQLLFVKLYNLLKPNSSFADFYNSDEARKQREV